MWYYFILNVLINNIWWFDGRVKYWNRKSEEKQDNVSCTKFEMKTIFEIVSIVTFYFLSQLAIFLFFTWLMISGNTLKVMTYSQTVVLVSSAGFFRSFSSITSRIWFQGKESLSWKFWVGMTHFLAKLLSKMNNFVIFWVISWGIFFPWSNVGMPWFSDFLSGFVWKGD